MNDIGILLDFDGTIIDDIVWEELDIKEGRKMVSERLGVELSEKEVRRFSGMNGMRSWRLLQESLEVPKKKYWEVFSEFQAELKKEQLENGILGTCDLEKLRKVENKAIVSNSPKKTLEILLDYLGIGNEFEAVVGPARFHEHRNLKPNTFLLERAMGKFSTELFVMVGNTWRDRKAAEKAGIPWRRVGSTAETDRVLEKYY